MSSPFSSTDYETTIINSSQIIDRTVKGIDIELGTIEINNLSAARNKDQRVQSPPTVSGISHLDMNTTFAGVRGGGVFGLVHL